MPSLFVNLFHPVNASKAFTSSSFFVASSRYLA
jgi:hypothetical protein